MSEQDHMSVTRRAFARLLVSGAAGLSLFAGCRPPLVTCYKPAMPTTAQAGGTPLQRWARIGEIWREITAHKRGDAEAWADPEARFKELRTEMHAALDDLPAWPELRYTFGERWQHVQLSAYPTATCYDLAGGGPIAAREKVEEQVDVLSELVAGDTLTEEAAGKAAAVLAVQAEFMARHAEADDETRGAVVEEYDAGETEPGESATLAGKRLVELELNHLEYLAGALVENEGLPRQQFTESPDGMTCYAVSMEPVDPPDD